MPSFIPIRILGTSFSLKTEEEPEYLNEIIQLYESKLEEIKSTIGVSDPLKLSILAGIIITEELKKERNFKGSIGPGEQQEIESMALKLIQCIDQVL